ncbi:DUF3800 domain-containing protein [Tenacibaculum finnmarkense]|uniref:DUF3800 domain-containing protein n=1 Tax=Tenacibaculum finnmarkense TaxID=2781243 RepID=UPI00187B5877|nr:DUF3800 domain-containing protein [Tenacibaculum finnmarkense]MBE7646809.1 DUF3800 domain-containing protein [Tenacibaculum finnmarkense genomovar ulcerans]MCD8422014.1 DUF3800 domain-containing protein [Tenacibaculum finnmarkense genomovar ulcerans]MCG8238140.1 DUF3800 domain-containing protein [Tenacibaculum finnmarkense genomovar ulcerans]MCG8795082.1 DUF3800 domain-containing protein [Tenacibaculum finnmarkense]MCG8797409.1 DUF3800 domain-containing protein [Tenacibaculum finnmarkense]
MNKTYNFYIDESCHLEHDDSQIMCIGYTKIAGIQYDELKKGIKNIKLKHKSPTEIKWNKVSKSRIGLYKDLIDFFFVKEIKFRCVLAKNKQNLNHNKYNDGNHSTFYNKVVYLLLNNQYANPILDVDYKVLLDIKDTQGKQRLNELAFYFDKKLNGVSPFKYFQHIHSNENEFMQLTDLFIGAITFKARKLHLKENASEVKCEIVSYLEKKSGYSLDDGTVPWETKFNIFDFQIPVSL